MADFSYCATLHVTNVMVSGAVYMMHDHRDRLCVTAVRQKQWLPSSGPEQPVPQTTPTDTHHSNSHHPSLACQLPSIVTWQVAAASRVCPGRCSAEPAPALPAAPGGLTLLLLLPAAETTGTAAYMKAAGAKVVPNLRLGSLVSSSLLAALPGRFYVCGTVATQSSVAAQGHTSNVDPRCRTQS